MDRLRTAAVHMRRGDFGEAASLLNRALSELQTAFRTRAIPSAALAKLMYSIETMLLMQQQGDWVGLADVIEYEFCPMWDAQPGS